MQVQKCADTALGLPRRLWFVRMPKPLEDSSGPSASEHEMESYRTQVAILNESLNVKRVRITKPGFLDGLD